MCLSVPARIISSDGKVAEVESFSKRRVVYLACEGAQVGDYVLLYGELALCVLNAEAAAETLDLLARLEMASSKSDAKRNAKGEQQ